MAKYPSRLILSGVLACSGPMSALAGGAYGELKTLASDPGSADAVYAGGAGRGEAEALPASEEKAGPQLRPSLGTRRGMEPREREETPPPPGPDKEEAARKGGIKGAVIGGILGGITGAVFAWGLGWNPFAILGGLALAAFGAYIGHDVGTACGPDPDCT